MIFTYLSLLNFLKIDIKFHQSNLQKREIDKKIKNKEPVLEIFGRYGVDQLLASPL